MAKILRPVQPQREPMSDTALDVLHILEPVQGRIIATAVLKYACKVIGAKTGLLNASQLDALIAPIERSLNTYDRLEQVGGALRELAGRHRAGGDAA